jgi:hypothetical protein
MALAALLVQVTKKLSPDDYAAGSKDGQYVYGLSVEVSAHHCCRLVWTLHDAL